MKILSLRGVVLTAAALLASSAAAQTQLRATPLDGAKAYELDGYSITSPPGKNWFELKRDRQSVYLGKRLPSRTHAFIATAVAADITERFEKPEQFREYLEKLPPDPDDKRTRIVENRADLDGSLGRFCARTYTRSVDRAAVYSGGKPLPIETYGYNCLHPDRPGLAINVSYSERGHPTEMSTELRAEGEAFLRSLRFAPRQP